MAAGKTSAKGRASESLAEVFGGRAGKAVGGHTEPQTQSCIYASGLNLQRKDNRGRMEMTALF